MMGKLWSSFREARFSGLCRMILYLVSNLADESELTLQLVPDHSMKLFISEIMSVLLSETSHSVAVLSVREKNADR